MSEHGVRRPYALLQRAAAAGAMPARRGTEKNFRLFQKGGVHSESTSGKNETTFGPKQTTTKTKTHCEKLNQNTDQQPRSEGQEHRQSRRSIESVVEVRLRSAAGPGELLPCSPGLNPTSRVFETLARIEQSSFSLCSVTPPMVWTMGVEFCSSHSSLFLFRRQILIDTINGLARNDAMPTTFSRSMRSLAEAQRWRRTSR